MSDPGAPEPATHPAATTGLVTLPEAASYLGLPEEAVRALMDGHFLQPFAQGAEGPLLATRELRAFMLWNVEDADRDVIDLAAVGQGAGAGQPEALLAALHERSDEMARQVFELFAEVFPEAQGWPGVVRARFVDQARGRFQAILALSGQGVDVDEALGGELQSVGSATAWEGATLPQLLVVLRISRDLVVQMAVQVAEELAGHWGLALSLLLTRVLPAMDRLTDSLAKGYWSAVVNRHKEVRARYEHVVEHASDGVYEVDLEGRIQYANLQLALVLGRRRLDELEGSLLTEVMSPLEGEASLGVLLHPSGDVKHVELTIARPDGVRRVLEVRTVSRLVEGELVGFQGVVRDVTAAHDLGEEKDRLLTSILDDLRLVVARLADIGAGLEAEGGRLDPDRLRHVGTSVVGTVERLSDLTERVARASRMAAELPVLIPRSVELAPVVHAALAGARAEARDVDVHVPAGLTVMADSEGLQRVVRELVDHAAQEVSGQREKGSVTVEVEGAQAGELQLAVSHPGSGDAGGG
ncbi:MAG: PAS domain S-box protein, partial [Actinomycetota bacterium]|nr:PAS domain S-box protein [Actinomycetota bacterium]MDQ3679371.1 PAS domain S-box protein [Actinomycetota bacterium]